MIMQYFVKLNLVVKILFRDRCTNTEKNLILTYLTYAILCKIKLIYLVVKILFSDRRTITEKNLNHTYLT